MGSQMGSVLGSPTPSRYGSYELQHDPVQEESLMGTEGESASLSTSSLLRPVILCNICAHSALQVSNRIPEALRVTGPSLDMAA